MLAGTPTGTSPERWNMCRCRPPASTRTCTQPWQGAIVVFGVLPRAADLVLRDPRGDEVGPVAGQLGELLHQVPELVEAAVLGGGEVMERAAVGPGPKAARRQPAAAGLLRRGPRAPPVAAELGQLGERRRAVDERAQFADGLAPERLQASLGDQREAVGQVETHRLLHQCQRRGPLPGGHAHPAGHDPLQQQPVLRVGLPLPRRSVLHGRPPCPSTLPDILADARTCCPAAPPVIGMRPGRTGADDGA